MAERLSCVDFESWAVLYAAGELSESERAAVEVHARECAACAAVLASETKLRDSFIRRSEAAEEMDGSGLLLAQCRSQLAEALDDEEKRGKQSGWRAIVSPERWATAFGHALATRPGWSGAALLILGALGGLGGQAWYHETSLPLPGKPR